MQEVQQRSRIPPGQIVTQGFPVLNAGSVQHIQRENWHLKVHGLVKNALDLSYEKLLELPRTVETVDIHCVTTWSKLDTLWEGVKFKDLMNLAEPQEEAKFVVLECEQGFTTNLPLEVLMDEDVLIAFKFGGKEITAEHGGPVRALVPKRYFYKSAKWLKGIKLVEKDEPGFWEVRGYSNSADPWNEERYTGLSYSEIIKNRLRAYNRRRQ